MARPDRERGMASSTSLSSDSRYPLLSDPSRLHSPALRSLFNVVLPHPPALEQGVDHAAIAQRLPPYPALPRPSHPGLLFQLKQKELGQLEQFHPRRRFRHRMEARRHPYASKSTRFPSPSQPALSPFYLAFKQTLDALPSHLLTPFNGPVPPSNLLDKIARGVAEAKGPADWPHSQRATRAKIVELAQRRARESTPIVGIAEESCEEDEPREVLQPSSRINRRRPLYRQSSMDFIPDLESSKKDNIKDNQSINRSVTMR